MRAAVFVEGGLARVLHLKEVSIKVLSGSVRWHYPVGTVPGNKVLVVLPVSRPHGRDI